MLSLSCYSFFFQLSLISSEAPTKVQTALKDVEDFSAKLDSLQAQFLVVKDSEKTVFNGTDQFIEELKKRLEVVDKFEMQKTYLQCIQIVESTRFINFVPSYLQIILKCPFTFLSVTNCNCVSNQIKIQKLLTFTMGLLHFIAE